MKQHAPSETRVLVIESSVGYAESNATIFEVPKYIPQLDDPSLPIHVERWPIHTIRQMEQNPRKFPPTPPKADPYDGVRLTIDPDLDPILALHYRTPQEGELGRLRKSLEVTRNDLELATETAKVYKDQRDDAYTALDEINTRVYEYNRMSFWGKLVFLLKGNVIHLELVKKGV